ncbi:MAG: hypothetical protein K9M99_02905 [Candidatus Cloacimonetes bacterium]|nr:hypothetical protein [Candidatus Cloacimonadota bacterium]
MVEDKHKLSEKEEMALARRLHDAVDWKQARIESEKKLATAKDQEHLKKEEKVRN